MRHSPDHLPSRQHRSCRRIKGVAPDECPGHAPELQACRQRPRQAVAAKVARRPALLAGTLLNVRTKTVFPQESWHAIRFGLFEPTMSYTGDAWVHDVLQPWTVANTATLAALAQIGRPEMAGVALGTDDP